MNNSVTITPETAIARLKTFCKSKGYIINSIDPEAISHADNAVLFCDRGQIGKDPADRYTVHGTYNGMPTIKAEGSLIEMLFDFGLLNKNEDMICDVIFSGENMISRRNAVRQPWHRSTN